jgi:hypothetical protein
MPVVKIFIRLELNENISFVVRHYFMPIQKWPGYFSVISWYRSAAQTIQLRPWALAR